MASCHAKKYFIEKCKIKSVRTSNNVKKTSNLSASIDYLNDSL